MSKIYNFVLAYVVSILSFGLIAFIITFVGYLFKISITSYHFWISIFGALVFLSVVTKKLFNKKNFWNHYICLIGALVLTFLGSILFNLYFIDLSYDGLAYHGEAILQLSKGYNPLYDRAESFNGIHDLWINAYPKLAWYQGAIFYKAFGIWSGVKYFSLGWILASLGAIWLCLSEIKYLSQTWIFRLITIFAVTPITINQAISLNLDGQVSSLILILVSFCVLSSTQIDSTKISNFKKYIYLFGLFASSVILISIKTTGLIYAIIILLAFLVYLFILKLKNWKWILKTFGLVAVFSLVLNFNPFITNIIHNGHPLYPQFNSKIDVKENTPSNYRDFSNLKIFVSSIFFESNNSYSDGDVNEPAKFKIPFSVLPDEIKSFQVASSLKKGGFGPWFSGAFVLTIILVGVLIWEFIKKNKTIKSNDYLNNTQLKNTSDKLYTTQLLVYILGVGLMSFLISGASNTYRFIPHFWFVIPIILIYALSYRSKLISILCYLISGILFLNLALITFSHYTYQYADSRAVERKLQILQTRNKPLLVQYGRHTATRAWFEDYGITAVDNYNGAITEDCDQKSALRNLFDLNDTLVCIEGYTKEQQKELLKY